MATVVHLPALSLHPAHPGLVWQPCVGCSFTTLRLVMGVLELLATLQACLCHPCPLRPPHVAMPPRLALTSTAPRPPPLTVTTRPYRPAVSFPAMRRLVATGGQRPRSRGASRGGGATMAATARVVHRPQPRAAPSGRQPTVNARRHGTSGLQRGGASEGTVGVSRPNPASMGAGTRREVWRMRPPQAMLTHLKNPRG